MFFFAEDMRIKLNTKRGFSRIQQALEYSRIARDVFELVKAVSKRADDIHRRIRAHELSCGNDSSASTTPLTPLTSRFVPYTAQRPIPDVPLSFLSQRPSGCSSPVSALDTTAALPSRVSTSISAFSRIQRDFFTSAYSDYGAVTSPLQASKEIARASSSQRDSPQSDVSPTLLYGLSFITPTSTSSSLPVSSPVTTQGQTQPAQGSYHPISTQLSSSASSHHSKSSRFSKPNRNKSYTHVNTFKYHDMTHRHCDCTPEDLEAAQAHFAQKGVVVNWSDHSRVQIAEGELCEVEHEIECRQHLFTCGIDDYRLQCRSKKGPRSHYQHSKSAVATCQSTPVHSATKSPSSPSTRKSASPLWHYPQGFSQLQGSPSDLISSRPSPAQENVLISLPGKLSSDDAQSDNVIGIRPSPTQEHVLTSQSSSSRIPTPPDLHSTLSCWIKNMNMLSSLIDQLQKLASSAPAECRSRVLKQVAALRTTSKEQKEHFMEFLQLSEDYANRYLFVISAEIRQQSSFLEKLERRLEAAKKLRGEAVELKELYESGTVAAMKALRATTFWRPLPEDQALFSEVDLMLTEIRRCYMELDKFWTEEIYRALEALNMRRVDWTDRERWKSFHANWKKIIESWKTELPSADTQTVCRNGACLSKEADIGAIAFSFSTAMGSLTSVLERLLSSNSLKYTRSGSSSIQPIYVAFAANSDLCLSLLRRCAHYGEKVIGLPSIAFPTTRGAMASHDLLERTMRLQSEMTRVSAGDAVSVQGSRKLRAVYNKALSLELKTTSELNTLLGKLSSWVTVTDSHVLPDGTLPDGITPEQLRKLWETARYSVRVALATTKDEPAPQLSTRPLSVIKRWLIDLVCFS